MMSAAVRSVVLGALRRGGVGIDAAALIAKYDPTKTGSLLFDFSKTDRTFQEATGQTLADDAGEAVGLALDSVQWAGATLDAYLASLSELLTNYSFDAGSTDWSLGASWSISAGQAGQTAGGGSGDVLSRTLGIGNDAIGDIYVIEIGAVSTSGTFTLNASRSGGAVNFASSGSVRRQFRQATQAGSGSFSLYSNPGQSALLDYVSRKKLPGFIGVQTASLSFRPTRQSGGVLRPDGTDDYLPLTYTPKLAQFYLQRINRGPNSATRILMGSTNTNRAFMGINGSNNLILGLGGTTHDTGLAVPSGDIVVAAGWDGTTKKAWVGSAAPYSAAQGADVPNTNTGIGLFANNSAGTFANFSSFDCRYAFALPALPTDAEVASFIATVGALA